MLDSFLNFNGFLFPKLTKVIYWIGLALIIIGAVVGAIGSLIGGNFIGFIMALVVGAIFLVVWRITVELWMVLFSIYDVLREIRDQRRTP